VQQRRVPELAAQPADELLDHTRIGGEVTAPDGGQQLLLGQDPPGVVEQVPKQAVLRGRELEGTAGPHHPVGVLVHLEVGDCPPPGRRSTGRASQDRVAARGDVERLGDVVVATEVHAGESVLQAVLRRHEHHREVGVIGPQGMRQVEAGPVGEHHVEQCQLGSQVGGDGAGLPARPRGADLEARDGQGPLEQVGEGRLVLDDEHPGVAHRAQDVVRRALWWDRHRCSVTQVRTVTTIFRKREGSRGVDRRPAASCGGVSATSARCRAPAGTCGRHH